MGRGALVFKGEAAKKKKKSCKIKNDAAADRVPPSTLEAVPAAEAAQIAPVALLSSSSSSTVPRRGTGTITTSGTVVTGYGTRFVREINVGDALLVHYDVDGDGEGEGSPPPPPPPEMRVVTMRLSDVSLNLSSALPQNRATPVAYSYIGKPRDAAGEAAAGRAAAAAAAADEVRHHGGRAVAGELVYRERTEHGNYRTRRVRVDSQTNRSDLLELRAKKTSDKYC